MRIPASSPNSTPPLQAQALPQAPGDSFHAKLAASSDDVEAGQATRLSATEVPAATRPANRTTSKKEDGDSAPVKVDAQVPQVCTVPVAPPTCAMPEVKTSGPADSTGTRELAAVGFEGQAPMQVTDGASEENAGPSAALQIRQSDDLSCAPATEVKPRVVPDVANAGTEQAPPVHVDRQRPIPPVVDAAQGTTPTAQSNVSVKSQSPLPVDRDLHTGHTSAPPAIVAQTGSDLSLPTQDDAVFKQAMAAVAPPVASGIDSSVSNPKSDAATGDAIEGVKSSQSVSLPSTAILPDVAFTNRVPGADLQKDASAGANNKRSDLGKSLKAGDAGRDKKDATGAANDGTSSSDSREVIQSAQHVHAESTPATATTIKETDPAAFQSAMQAAQSHSESAQLSSRQHAAEGYDAAPLTSQREGATALSSAANEIPSAKIINTAHLIQSMSQSEMRIGMHSAEFGSVSVRTSVTQQQLLTQITVDHAELGRALSAHLPAAEAKLGNEYGLHAVIEVHDQGAAFSGDTGDRSRRNQEHASSATGATIGSPMESKFDLNPAAWAMAGDAQRLDIRA